MSAWDFVFGSLVGFSLGLTGGGGAIFAVPLLVYGRGLPAREAVDVSLLTVGITALVGCVQRWVAGQVELKTGLLFAGAGMLGAPAGAWIAGRLPAPLLLVLFALLMLVIAVRMLWPSPPTRQDLLPILDDGRDGKDAGPTCRRDPEGKLNLTSRCAMILAVAGLATGVLSGLFGVGGGFIIVPALVAFSGMGMQRAIGTSLLVMTLIAGAGFVSHIADGAEIPWRAVPLFAGGAIAGLFGGTLLGRRLDGPMLKRVFGIAIILVALFVIARSILW